MTEQELRAAAERLRNNDYGGYKDHFRTDEDYDEYWMPVRKWSDLNAVGEAYLAEYPADDGERADSEWAALVGFRWSADGTAMCLQVAGSHGMQVLLSGDLYACEKDTGLSVTWSYGGVSLDYGIEDNPTRGHVRRLCAALGVPLTESPDA